MASNNVLFEAFAVVIAIVVPTFALATVYKVGDDQGWTVNFDYTAWASDKEFRVGDKLVFVYPKGKHNVFKVDGAAFKDCVIPSDENEALSSGNDEIPLVKPGKKWYICGVAKHCAEGGQKLSIDVLPAAELAPSPTPPTPAPPVTPGGPSSAYKTIASGYQAIFAAAPLAAMAMVFA